MKETLTIKEAEALSKASNELNSDLKSIFDNLEAPSNYFHESKKIIQITVKNKDGKDQTLKFMDVGVTYKRKEPKPLSKKARKKLKTNTL